MKARTVKLTYNLKSKIEMIINEHGDHLFLFIDGNDRTENGDAWEHAITAVTEAGHNIQRDISVAFELQYYQQAHLEQGFLQEQVTQKLTGTAV